MKNETELRIGNLIRYRDEKNCIVSSLGSNGFETVNTYNGLANGSSDLFEYNPIPLTEEWLFRFGFRKTFDSPFEDFEWSDNNLQLSENFDCYLGKFTQPIKYVHQLQNLYFALTGEELTLIDG